MNLAQGIMENQRGKGLSFARRIYMPRTVGLGIGCICVTAALYPLNMPGWVWILMLVNGFVWPHVAYQMATRSPYPYRAERRNIIGDSLCGGFWAATVQFNPIVTVTILSMMTMNNVAAGGPRLFLHGALAQIIGALIAWSVFGIAFTSTATPVQVWACLPSLVIYPLAVGIVCYRLAFKLAEHKRALSALSRTDSLTGLLNHGSWKDLLHVKFQQSRHNQIASVIALIDIDHFKTINDSYGHIIGDSVLRQMSFELRRSLRDIDLAGRYGGDEFCVILPNMSLQQAGEIMERLREVLNNYRHPHVPQLQIKLSIGLAAYQPTFSDATAWLNAADKALYTAKNTGRNKISIADSLAIDAATTPISA